MAVEINFTRDIAGNLRPYSDEDKNAVWLLDVGKKYRADVVVPRDNKRLNWWWKLASIISENDDRWPSAESASDMLKLRCGHFNTLIVPSAQNAGEFVTQYTPKSIKLRKMEEDEFKELCGRAVHVASVCLACETDQLWDALDAFFGGRIA